MTKNRLQAAGHLTALFTIILWGTTFISTKVLLKDFSPVEILFLRFALGYIVLLAVHPHIVKTTCLKDELLFMGAGVCGVTLYFLLENMALAYSTASNVGIIVAVSPFFTAILVPIFLKGERPHVRFFVGFAIAIVGIVLVSFNGRFVLKLNPVGDLLAVLAALAWSFYSIFMRKVADLPFNNIACTRRIFFYGLVFMLPTLPFMNFNIRFDDILKTENLLNLLYLGLGASALCFVTWNWTLTILGTIKTNAYIYVVPVVAVVSSVIILHEQLTAVSVIGSVLILAGLILSERRQKPVHEDPPPQLLEEDPEPQPVKDDVTVSS